MTDALEKYRKAREEESAPAGAVARADLYLADAAIKQLEEKYRPDAVDECVGALCARAEKAEARVADLYEQLCNEKNTRRKYVEMLRELAEDTIFDGESLLYKHGLGTVEEVVSYLAARREEEQHDS